MSEFLVPTRSSEWRTAAGSRATPGRRKSTTIVDPTPASLRTGCPAPLTKYASITPSWMFGAVEEVSNRKVSPAAMSKMVAVVAAQSDPRWYLTATLLAVELSVFVISATEKPVLFPAPDTKLLLEKYMRSRLPP